MLFFILHKEGLIWGMEEFWKDFIVTRESGKCFYREQCEYFIESGRIEIDVFRLWWYKVVQQISFFRIFENFDKTKFCVLDDNGGNCFCWRDENYYPIDLEEIQWEQRIVMRLISLIKRFLKSRVVVSSSWWRFWHIKIYKRFM